MKRRANTKLFGPEPFCGLATSTIRSGTSRWIQKLSEDQWINEPILRHSKSMIAIPQRITSKKFICLSQRKLRVKNVFLTGHETFKASLKLFNIINEDTYMQIL